MCVLLNYTYWMICCANAVYERQRGNYNAIGPWYAWVVIVLNRYVREGDFNRVSRS